MSCVHICHPLNTRKKKDEKLPVAQKHCPHHIATIVSAVPTWCWDGRIFPIWKSTWSLFTSWSWNAENEMFRCSNIDMWGCRDSSGVLDIATVMHMVRLTRSSTLNHYVPIFSSLFLKSQQTTLLTRSCWCNVGYSPGEELGMSSSITTAQMAGKTLRNHVRWHSIIKNQSESVLSNGECDFCDLLPCSNTCHTIAWRSFT